MKIAIYHPPQHIVAKDLVFCKHTEHDFFPQQCNPNIDLIYSCSTSMLPQAIDAKHRFKKPLVCWCWDIPYNWRDWDMSLIGMELNSGRDVSCQNTISFLRKCDLVISASRWTQNVLKNRFGIESEQIYFYINTDEIDAVKTPVKQNNIIQVSRFFYNKKFEHTIAATKNLDDYNVILNGVGLDSPYGNELRAKAAWRENITFVDNVKRAETIKLIKSAAVLVSPSVFEGWGITPVEALYCDVPVLLSDLDVFKEVYGDNVLYHKKNDPIDMGQKLELLLADRDLQEKMVRACKPIISDFTPKRFAQRWNSCIKKV